MVRLSPDSEARDQLKVLAADRRELALEIVTNRPLRHRAKGHRELREVAIQQIEDRLDKEARRAFRGRVAIELSLAVPAGRFAAQLQRVVKAYIDLLPGLVVSDDAVVDHLLVTHDTTTDSNSTARLRCFPLAVFCDEFDRAFRIAPEIGLPERGSPAPFRDGARQHVDPRRWGLGRFDEHDQWFLADAETQLALIDDLDAHEDEQLQEDPDAWVDLDVPSTYAEFADGEVRDNVRAHLEDTIPLMRGRWFADHAFGALDRPGPAPRWLLETAAMDVADIELPDDTGPGSFLLPPPPDRPQPSGRLRWDDQICSAFQQRRWRQLEFPGPIALDIALLAGAGDHMDVDNVARRVAKGFSSTLPVKPVIAGYRVYRRRGDTPGVRVRVIPIVRLEALADAMRRARGHVRGTRSERLRPLD